ncbi:MAG: VOC family protein [Dehalococcoidia bacterium]
MAAGTLTEWHGHPTCPNEQNDIGVIGNGAMPALLPELRQRKEKHMKVGPLSHVGIVVEDMDKAVEYYSSVFGIGPFHIEVYDLSKFSHKGQSIKAKVKAGIAYTGSAFVELVQVLEGETPHSKFLREKGEGLQHVAFSVENIDEALEELAEQGIEPLMRYSLTVGGEDESGASGGKQFEVHEAYLDSEKIGGTVIQLLEIRHIQS